MDLGLVLHVDAQPVADAGSTVKATSSGIVRDFGAMDAAAGRTQATLGALSPVAQQLFTQYARLREQVQTGAIAHGDYLKQQQLILDQLAKLPAAASAGAAAYDTLTADLLRQGGAAEAVAVSTATLADRHRSLGEAMLASSAAARQYEAAQARANAVGQASLRASIAQRTPIALPGPVRNEVNQLRGLGIETRAVAAQEERLAALRIRLQQAAAAQGVFSLSTVATGSALDRIQRPLQAVLIGAVGLPGPLGRAAAALSTLAIGGSTTIGVLAAGAAIYAIWQKQTQGAREAAAATEAYRERLAQLRAEQPRAPVAAAVEDLQRSIEERDAAIRKIEELQQKLSALDAQIATGRASGIKPTEDLSFALVLKQRLETERQITEEIGKQKSAEDAVNLTGAAHQRAFVGLLKQRIDLARGFLDLQVDTVAQTRTLAGLAQQLRLFAADATKDAGARLQALQAVGAIDAQRTADARARQSAVQQLADAELQATLAVLKIRGEFVTADRLALSARLDAIEREARAVEGLTKAERERLALVRAQVAVIEATATTIEQTTAALNRAAKAGAAQGPLAVQRAISTGDQTPIRLSQQDRILIDADLTAAARKSAEAYNDALRARLEIEQQQIALQAEARQAALSFAVGLGALSPAVGHVVGGVSELVAQLATSNNATDQVAVALRAYDLAVQKHGASSGQAAEASLDVAAATDAAAAANHRARIALAGLIAALGDVAFQGNSSASAVGRGVTAGVSTAVATGNPLLGAGTAILGTISGLLAGSAQRAAEIDALNASVERFAERSLPSVAVELRGLDREFKELSDEARRLGEPTRELTREYARQRKAIEERAALEEQAFNRELEARQAAADGRAGDAARIRRDIADEEEIRDAQARGYSAATIAALKYTQGIEATKAAAEAAAQALRDYADQVASNVGRTFTGLDIQQDIITRNRRLTGDDAGAERSEIIRETIRKQADAYDLLSRGIIDQATYTELLTLATQEQIAAFTKLDEAIAATIAAEAARIKQTDEDLDVRLIRGQGNDQAADDLAFDIGQQRERDRAVLEGWSAVMIEKLDGILRLEKQNYDASKTTADTVTDDVRQRSQPLMAQKVVGALTEVTGVTMTSYLASMNVYLAEISQNTAGLRGGTPRASAATVGAIATPLRPVTEAMDAVVERVMAAARRAEVPTGGLAGLPEGDGSIVERYLAEISHNTAAPWQGPVPALPTQIPSPTSAPSAPVTAGAVFNVSIIQQPRESWDVFTNRSIELLRAKLRDLDTRSATAAGRPRVL